MNRARRSGRISFDAIRDDDADICVVDGWSSPWEWCDTMAHQAKHFALDRQQGQEARRIIMVEAAGMKPQIARVVAPYGVPVLASGGFDSTTANYQLATAIGEHAAVELLHVGDYDPSGVHIFTSMAQDVEAFVETWATVPS